MVIDELNKNVITLMIGQTASAQSIEVIVVRESIVPLGSYEFN